MPTINLTADDVFVALRTFILAQLGSNVSVIQGLSNRTPMPKGGFVVMTMLYSNRLATNSHTNDDDSQTITKPHDVAMQIDCYGEQSFEWATVLSTLLRDEIGVSGFPAGIAPLYADDPRLIPLVNAEQQYEKRWMVEAHFQVNSSVTINIQTANTLGDVIVYHV